MDDTLMEAPADPETWINMLWTGFSALWALFMALLLWNMRRQVAASDSHGTGIAAHNTRITILESTSITREDFDEMRASLTATAAHNQKRTETRMDRLFEKVSELKK